MADYIAREDTWPVAAAQFLSNDPYPCVLSDTVYAHDGVMAVHRAYLNWSVPIYLGLLYIINAISESGCDASVLKTV